MQAALTETPLYSFEQQGAVGIFRITREQKRNALNDALIANVRRVFTTLPESVKAVVIDGEGAHFCAGLDLGSLGQRTAAESVMHSASWHEAFHHIQFGRVPVIAALHGAVVGGGLELASAAHVRVADSTAFYALPEAQHGLFVGGGGSVRIPRLIGVARMTDMMLTGRVYDAAEGHAIGLAQYLVEEGQAFKHAMALAQKMTSNAPITNFGVMHVLPRIASQPMTEGFLIESLMAGIASSSADAQERMQAFLDKRAGKVGKPG